MSNVIDWTDVRKMLPDKTGQYWCRNAHGSEFPAWWVLQKSGNRTWLSLGFTVHEWKPLTKTT